MGLRIPALLQLLAVLAVCLAAPRDSPARDRPIELREQDLRLSAMQSEKVTRRVCKKVLHECRKAYAKIANRLALNSSRIFFAGERLPMWMSDTIRKDPAFRVIVEAELRSEEQGAVAYLKRMDLPRYTIYIPAPADDLTPDDVHRVWREMAHAIIGNTAWRACPLWLREGIAEHLATEATESGHTLYATLTDELEKAKDTLDLKGVLTATNRKAWEQLHGRAVSWALVRILDRANNKLVPSLFNQSRLLLNHLVHSPSNKALLTEYTGIVFDQLEASGMTEVKLKAALENWIGAGCPEGAEARKLAASKPLRRMRLPSQYGIGATGRFGSRLHIEDDYGRLRHYQPFEGGKIVWRLPWRSTMEAWVGVRGVPGTNYALRPNKANEGYYVPYNSWRAGRKDETTLRAIRMELPRMLCKYGFIWVQVTSPGGLGYVFQKEYKLK